MRMTLTLDERLVQEAKEVFGVATKREAVERALSEAVRLRRQKKALDHCGTLDLDADQETLAKLRAQS